MAEEITARGARDAEKTLKKVSKIAGNLPRQLRGMAFKLMASDLVYEPEVFPDRLIIGAADAIVSGMQDFAKTCEDADEDLLEYMKEIRATRDPEKLASQIEEAAGYLRALEAAAHIAGDYRQRFLEAIEKRERDISALKAEPEITKKAHKLKRELSRFREAYMTDWPLEDLALEPLASELERLAAAVRKEYSDMQAAKRAAAEKLRHEERKRQRQAELRRLLEIRQKEEKEAAELAHLQHEQEKVETLLSEVEAARKRGQPEKVPQPPQPSAAAAPVTEMLPATPQTHVPETTQPEPAKAKPEAEVQAAPLTAPAPVAAAAQVAAPEPLKLPEDKLPAPPAPKAKSKVPLPYSQTELQLLAKWGIGEPFLASSDEFGKNHRLAREGVRKALSTFYELKNLRHHELLKREQELREAYRAAEEAYNLAQPEPHRYPFELRSYTAAKEFIFFVERKVWNRSGLVKPPEEPLTRPRRPNF